jgi:hypothetical protein
MASPSEKLRGTSTRRTPSARRARAITAAGVAVLPAASSAFAYEDHERTSSTRACARARSISRSLITRIRRRPLWMNRNGSGAKKPVGWRMSASVSEAA